MIFRRKRSHNKVSHADWMSLVHFQQMQTLAIARLTLQVVTNPEVVTDELQKDLAILVRDLEDRMAVYEEHVV